jgi:serine O-acetyltransferase
LQRTYHFGVNHRGRRDKKKDMNILIEKLLQAHSKYDPNIPAIQDAKEFLTLTLGFLIPHLSKRPRLTDRESYQKNLEEIKLKLDTLLSKTSSAKKETSETFFSKLSSVYDSLMLDAEAIFKGDPAAKSIDEVIVTYPGFFAIAVHRLAHELYKLNVAVLPRLFSEYAHRATGIDINPGAEIGKNFCIDHGTGLVIGETTVIMDNVKIYQGVTLGALSVEKSMADKKRHPTIQENVVIYANATILGGDTVIGKNSIIGGNVWITSSVPENSVVYHRDDTKIKSDSNVKNP